MLAGSCAWSADSLPIPAPGFDLVRAAGTVTTGTSGGTVGTTVGTVAYTAIPVDPPFIGFASATGTIFAGTSLRVPIVLSQASTAATSVTLAIDSASTAVDAADATVIDAGDDFKLSSTTITIPAGQTSAYLTILAAAGTKVTANRTLVLDIVAATGALVQPLPAKFTAVIAPQLPIATKATIGNTAATGTTLACSVGQTISIDVYDGLPLSLGGTVTYDVADVTGTTGGLTFVVSPLTTSDVDGNGTLDPVQHIQLAALTPGKHLLNINDATGNGTLYTINAAALTALAPGAAGTPIVPYSSDAVVNYAPIGAGTAQTLAGLEATANSLDPSKVALFSWDAKNGYAVWPAVPTGGLTLDHGLFVATRVPLNLAPVGPAAAMYTTVTLQPGWNLIAIPVVSDGTLVSDRHDLSAMTLFDDVTGAQVTGAARTAAIGDGAQLWNPASRSYSKVTILTSANAYWIHNATADQLHLVRVPAASVLVTDAMHDLGSGVSFLNQSPHDIGGQPAAVATSDTPPAPPAGNGDGGEGTSGCGLGSAGVVLSCLGLGWALRRRRIRTRV